MASTGSYNDLAGLPALGTAAYTASTDYATAAQGTLADTAVQPADLATVASTGSYNDLSGLPALGTAAYTASTDYATAAQGTLADTAVQPADNISTLTNDAGYLTIAPAPFVPLAVTGTTPSLDVGTYNFFDNGTLTGDTTVTFASVPTEARWTYSFVGASASYDLSIASYVQSFSVSAQESNPYYVFFKPDGLRMYVVGSIGDDINEYSLSTAWDVSTASYVRLFSVATQDTLPRGLFFKPDGTKMYVVGGTGDAVYEYDVGALATMTLPASVQNTPQLGLDGEARVTYDFFTLDGGTNVYLIGEEVT